MTAARSATRGTVGFPRMGPTYHPSSVPSLTMPRSEPSFTLSLYEPNKTRNRFSQIPSDKVGFQLLISRNNCYNFDAEGCPWKSREPNGRKTWIECLFGEHIMRHAVSVFVPSEKADEVAKYLPRLPYPSHCGRIIPARLGRPVKKDAANEDAVDRIKRELAGSKVEVIGIDFDFNTMPNGGRALLNGQDPGRCPVERLPRGMESDGDIRGLRLRSYRPSGS